MDGLVIDTIELTVLNSDIIDGVSMLRVLIANNHHAVFRLLTGNILHRHIADSGVETTTAHLARFVVGIELEDSLATLTYGNVTHIDILDDTTTATIGLNTQYTVKAGRVHLTVFCIDILTTTADFRANDYATMTIVEFTVTNDDVLRWTSGILALTTFSTVVITSALDGDTVVASIEIAILNEHTVA